ncbi:MAG: hypothetical protein IPL79_20185 [Myxococcales bacterium]|nr:hypothetical protein [Myxococcales bacterium]
MPFKRKALVRDGRGDLSLVGDIERLSNTARNMLRHLSKVYKRMAVDDTVHDKDLVSSIAKVSKVYEGLIKMLKSIKSDTQQTLMKMSSYDRLRMMAKFLSSAPEEDRIKVMQLAAIPYIRDATVIKAMPSRSKLPAEVNAVLNDAPVSKELVEVGMEEFDMDDEATVAEVEDLVDDAVAQKDEAWDRRNAASVVTKVERPMPFDKFEEETTSEIVPPSDWLEGEPGNG